MKKLILCFTLLLSTLSVFADVSDFKSQRKYETVVMRGWNVKQFYNIPINEIYLYAFDENSQQLKLIPFQIDERILTNDIFNENITRHYYANASLNILDDGKFDEDDELVFLVADMGSEAPESAWTGIDVNNSLRRTILIADPNDPMDYAVCYIVHSLQKKEIPSPYHFSYDVANDIITNSVYSVKISRPSGLIQDVKLFPPYGNGVDIFDTQKIRLIGIVDLGLISLTPGLNGQPALNDRDNFYIYPQDVYINATEKPVVRLVREVRQTIRVGPQPIEGITFYVGTKFYPFSGELEGGASLNPEKLRELFPDPDDIQINFDLVRQSWDFNENATGMKFFNRNNDGITIDGNPDNVNRKLNTGGIIEEWSMASGEQGTFFAHLTIHDTTYQNFELYYHDNKEGGQDDESYVDGGDTGDSKSFGDQGVKIFNSQSLELGFTAYFIGKNQNKSVGEQLAYNVKNPPVVHNFTVKVKENSQSLVRDFKLYQNYPNPFNNSTKIVFDLDKAQWLFMDIVNLRGERVKTLVNQRMQAGQHSYMWDGTNDSGSMLTSGIYLVRLSGEDGFTLTKKLILTK